MQRSFRKNKYVLTGSTNKCAKIWTPDSGKCLQELIGHNGMVTCVSVTPKADAIGNSKETSTAENQPYK